MASGDRTRARAILEHVLDHLGAPAFLCDATGAIVEASRSGRALVDRHKRTVPDALRAAISGEPATLGFEITEIAVAPKCWLAIARPGSNDERVAFAVASATTRWSLTPRQRDVLELLVRGVANSTIAAQLKISRRAVEFHVTAIFDRVGVDSRASLVAIVLA